MLSPVIYLYGVKVQYDSSSSKLVLTGCDKDSVNLVADITRRIVEEQFNRVVDLSAEIPGFVASSAESRVCCSCRR